MNLLKTICLAFALLSPYACVDAEAQTNQPASAPKGEMRTRPPANGSAIRKPANEASNAPAKNSASATNNGNGSTTYSVTTDQDVEAIFWGPMPRSAKWNKDALIGQAGIGLFSYGGAYGLSVPLYLAADYGVHERFGVGGTLGYAVGGYNSRVLGSRYHYRRSAITLAARGTYHVNLEPDKFDLYAGASLGVRAINYSYPETGDNGAVYRTNDRFVRPTFSLFLGARYFFTPSLAAFGELGGSVSWLSGGLAYKFR